MVTPPNSHICHEQKQPCRQTHIFVTDRTGVGTKLFKDASCNEKHLRLNKHFLRIFAIVYNHYDGTAPDI